MFLTKLAGLFGRKTEISNRIPGNMQKKIFRARARSFSKGYTIAAPGTQEFKRIIVASMRKPKPAKNAYGGKYHLKWLKALIVGAEIAQLKRKFANAV
jgi:hypothetical protein